MIHPINIQIVHPETQYPIIIEPGGLSRLGTLIRQSLPNMNKVMVITNPTIQSLYGDATQHALESQGLQVHTVHVPDGEASKSLAQLEALYHHARELGLSRQDGVLALGGGVIGDLAGFCAATYYRGVAFIQAPTTLLAQVDSSVGGKVAVNFQDIKNGIGSFYQPALVLADTEVLKTQPKRELLAGLAEVIKYGLIEETATGHPGEFFQFFQRVGQQWRDHLPFIIETCCRMKAAVVQRDERETITHRAQGRICLNLGHTFGHAYEALSGYGQLLHGEAVSMGMVQACRLAEKLNQFDTTGVNTVEETLQELELPISPPPGLSSQEILAVMRHDKKASNNKFRFILPHQQIGKVNVRDDVPEEALQDLLSETP